MCSQRARAAVFGAGALLLISGGAIACDRGDGSGMAQSSQSRATQGAEARTLQGDPSARPDVQTVQLGTGTGIGVSDEEVAEFSRVQVGLLQLHAALSERAQLGEDPALLQLELQERAEALIEESELPVERLSEIAQQAQDDPGLRDRVEAHVREQLMN